MKKKRGRKPKKQTQHQDDVNSGADDIKKLPLNEFAK